MLSNPKCGLCGDCASKQGKSRERAIEAATQAIRDLEVKIVLLDHKDFLDLQDQAEMRRLTGELLCEYRKGWEAVIGKKIVDMKLTNIASRGKASA